MKRMISLVLALALLCTVSLALAEAKWTFGVSLTEADSEYAILVNKEHLLESKYVPSPLVKIKGIKKTTDMQLQETAFQALQEFYEAACAVTSYEYTTESGKTETKTYSDGMKLIVKSAYRSYSTQKTMYNNRLEREGKDDGVVQAPGASEHQTGLCVDILSVEYQSSNSTMKQDFKWTPEAQWMLEHCAEYGFILRYPENKEDITGIIFEPWHFRYVGKEVAEYIMAKGICLEEFHEELEEAKAEFVAAGGDLEAQKALEYEKLNALPESVILDIYDEDGDPEVSLEF